MMRDPLTWSLNLGRWPGGITVRVSILLILFFAFQVYSFYDQGEFVLGLYVMGILWFSILLHEYGHCYAARWIGGHADEILMWPLGGLAFVDVGNNPRAQWIATAGGPAVNLLLCVATAPVLIFADAGSFLNPLYRPDVLFSVRPAICVLAHVFWINWILLLINLLPGFPLDGGRLLRCWLWARYGFGRATLITVQAAKVTAIALFLLALFGTVGTKESSWSSWALMLVFLAVVMYMLSERERQLLEAGLLFDDSVFGYDFSQGYTSLEKSSASIEQKEPGFWQRWRMRRAQLKQERDQARKREEERRVDQILARIAEQGIDSISESDRRFLNRASARYRSRRR